MEASLSSVGVDEEPVGLWDLESFGVGGFLSLRRCAHVGTLNFDHFSVTNQLTETVKHGVERDTKPKKKVGDRRFLVLR